MQFLSIYHILWILIFCFSIISVSVLPALGASDLNPIRTPSTGYQPHFQVSGNKIYYVWHEYDGPFPTDFHCGDEHRWNGLEGRKENLWPI